MALGKVRPVFGLLLLVYIMSPVVFKYSTFIQRSPLFMNRVNLQPNLNLSRPELVGIKCSRPMRLEHANEPASSEPTIQLGVWHILPASSLAACTTEHHSNHTSTTIADEHAFEGARPIVLYVHGNGGSRAGDHRRRLYRRLAYELDYHIVTFDYRGYGDSTYEAPTAAGLTSDARFMYDWLLQQPGVARDRVVVWGHSLGTAVAVRMVSGLQQERQPRRLVLEAPFDSLASAIANHPFSVPFRPMPYFEYFFVEPIQKSAELNFDSLAQIGHIKATPILILHAEDDAIVPFKLGKNLFEVVTRKLGKSRVALMIPSHYGLGHIRIHEHNETMLGVDRFIADGGAHH